MLTGKGLRSVASDCGYESRGFESPSPTLESTALNESQSASTPCNIKGLRPMVFVFFLSSAISPVVSESHSVAQVWATGEQLESTSADALSVSVVRRALAALSVSTGRKLGSFSTAPARSYSRR